MTKLDIVKADIAFHEKLFFGALAVLVALVGWLASHYQEAAIWLMLLAVIAIFSATGFVVVHYRKIKRLIRQLGDL